MKYITYLMTAIVSTVLVISLSGILPGKPESIAQYQHQFVGEAWNRRKPPIIEAVMARFPRHLVRRERHATLVVDQPIKNQVKIVNFKYEPANLKVAAGETIQFINQDEEPHTVSAKDGSFDSKALDTEQTWTHTFTQTGTFPYFCAVHPYMKATVTVTPKGKKT